jgi:hypothetical protein
MPMIDQRSIYVRNARGEWWIGSGSWSAAFSGRALHFSEEQYAWLDVGRFADDGTHLVEQVDGQWVQVSKTEKER